MSNPVAKHCRTFNKATVERDKTKFHRPSKLSLLDEWLEEVDFDEDDWKADTTAEENEGWDECSCISASIYTRIIKQQRIYL